jgi:uncharacterized integral membrane protein
MLKKISLVVKRIILSLVILFLLAFVVTNAEFVKVNVAPFGYEIKIRSFLLIIISFLAGAIFGYFCDIFNIAKIREKIMNGRKLRDVENELKRIKANEK